MSKTPTTLIIMDGFGLRAETAGNAVTNARKPVLDKIFDQCPGCRLSASGLDVGLPEGQMGNSEVGHTNIGAGRVVFQDLPRISKSIADGDFFQNEAYLDVMRTCKGTGAALHVFGLLSDGGVHSHNSHIYALLKLAKEQGLSRVWIHAFLDGRDVPPASGKGYVEDLIARCAKIGIGQIATGSGRYYAMDRDKRWDRVQLAYDAIAEAKGVAAADPVAAVQASYDQEVTDEFVIPAVVKLKFAAMNLKKLAKWKWRASLFLHTFLIFGLKYTKNPVRPVAYTGFFDRLRLRLYDRRSLFSVYILFPKRCLNSS